MSRRKLLTEDERAHLFGIPIDEAGLARHYTLSPDDLELLHAKRGARNILGAAVQLALLRHPGFGAAMSLCPTRCCAIWRNNWVFRSVRSVTTPPGRKRDRTTPRNWPAGSAFAYRDVATCR